MNPINGVDFKGTTRKLYPNPSAINLTGKVNSTPNQPNGFYGHVQNNGKRVKGFRRTDHTDQHASQRSPSRSGVFSGNYGLGQINGGIGEQQGSAIQGDSRVSRGGAYSHNNNIKVLTQNQQKVIELRERLKNIHHFYRIRIQQQRNKNLERNQIFIGIIEDLQRSHNEKMAQCQKSLQELEDEKRDVNYVDERMQSIKSTIEQILAQSRELKEANEHIQKQILQKQLIIKEKEQHYVQLKEEIESLRAVLQNCERLKLKQNRRNKQLLQLIESNLGS